MVPFRKIRLLLIAVIGIYGCDESWQAEAIEPPEPITISDWQYQFVVFGGDTMRFVAFGEPTLDEAEYQTEFPLQFLRYKADYSYELLSPVGRRLGRDQNYQPNFGYWNVSQNGDTITHNKLMVYETKYYIIKLTEDSLIRRKVGGHYNFDTQSYEEFIEVLLAKPY